MTEHLRASPPQRYEEISQHLLEQAQRELDNGDILQASEKSWGATAHAIKAVAQQRGWNHHTHNNLRDAAVYIGLERNRQDLRQLFQSLEALHHNYYGHQREAGEVQDAIDGAESIPGKWRDSGAKSCQPGKTRYSHGDVYGEDELDKLPSVRPAPTQ